MGKAYGLSSTRLICTQCESVNYIQRVRGKGRKEGHVKPVECGVCHQKTDHLEKIATSVELVWVKLQIRSAKEASVNMRIYDLDKGQILGKGSHIKLFNDMNQECKHWEAEWDIERFILDFKNKGYKLYFNQSI